MAAEDDSDLVTRWRTAAGEAEREEAFRRIFERYYRPVVGFFRKRGFSRNDCEDLAQEVFLRMHRSLKEFRGEARFETWLFQITANLFRNTLRGQSALKREGKEVSLDSAPALCEPLLPPAEGPSPLEQCLEHERETRLEEAVRDLPPQMRRCVALRIGYGLRYREIAELLRISDDTVKTHLLQARQRLRSDLRDCFRDLDLK